MKRFYQYGWVFLAASLLHAKPLTPEEVQLTDTAFALQELKEHTYDLLYFLPDNASRALRVIRGLISHAKKDVKAALFRLTEASIARALIDAHERGVSVEVVVDPGALEAGHYSKVGQLIKAGIPVYCYQATDLFPLSKAGKTSYQTLMHHKTLVLDVDTKKIVIFGSLNLTHAGFNGNEELVMFRVTPEVVEAFEEHIAKLKARSEPLLLTDFRVKNKKQKSAKQVPLVQTALSRVQHVVAQSVPYVKRALRVIH